MKMGSDQRAMETSLVWGLPLAPWTLSEATKAVARLIEERRPAYFITANLHYAMLSHQLPDLEAINRDAAFILADGMPLVWASRASERPLPERVAGSDLIFELCRQAASLSHRVFLVGGQPGVGVTAAHNLRTRFPGLQIVGVEAPPFRPLSQRENGDLVSRIRDAGTDLLLVAFGQPRGERWIRDNLAALGVPACVQVGASLDFAAGRIRRAPSLLQRYGMEWTYRLYLEPGRLGGRYFRNIGFFLRMAACGFLHTPRA